MCLLNLHVDDVLGGTFDRLEYGIRIQHNPVSLNMPPSILGCCESEENATPVSSCDIFSACEEPSFLLSSVKTSVGWGVGGTMSPAKGLTSEKIWTSWRRISRVAEGLGVTRGLGRHLE